LIDALHASFDLRLTAGDNLSAGDVIVDQFSGQMGERMKRSYGMFCSRHKEGIDYYKQIYRADKRFQAFIKVHM